MLVSAEDGFEGSGTQEDPYLISTAADLQKLSASVNGGISYAGCYFEQTADIDMSGIAFTPIGIYDSGKYFYGVYDGGGYSISSLTIGPEGNNGMFGHLGGIVANLALIDCSVTGSCLGTFASHGIGSATVVNCYVVNPVLNGFEGRYGLIADNGVTIINCYAYTQDPDIPMCSYSAPRVSNCITNGNVVVNDETFSGTQGDNSTNMTGEYIGNRMNEYMLKAAGYIGDYAKVSFNYWTEDSAEVSFTDEKINYGSELNHINIIFVVLLCTVVVVCVIYCVVAIVLEHRKKMRGTAEKQ